jgi:pimeloyl-ACP methyl ester carboxylesterase
VGPTTGRTDTVSYLSRPGGRIAYRLQGEGSGLHVVCVPGMGDLSSVYRFVVPHLVDAGFQVAVMDLRGHGDSDATFASYDDVAAGGDVLALIQNLGGPAVVLGNSMGAAAAAWAAAESPADVAGLVLIGPFVRNPPTSRLALLAFRLVLLRPWGRSAWRIYYASQYPGRRPPDLNDHLRRLEENLRRSGHWRAFVRTTHTSHAPVESRLSQVVAPTLVIMGERDRDFADPAGEARLIAERLQGEVLLVPQAGHYPQAEYPEIVAPAIVSFVRRVSGGRQ